MGFDRIRGEGQECVSYRHEPLPSRVVGEMDSARNVAGGINMMLRGAQTTVDYNRAIANRYARGVEAQRAEVGLPACRDQQGIACHRITAAQRYSAGNLIDATDLGSKPQPDPFGL